MSLFVQELPEDVEANNENLSLVKEQVRAAKGKQVAHIIIPNARVYLDEPIILNNELFKLEGAGPNSELHINYTTPGKNTNCVWVEPNTDGIISDFEIRNLKFITNAAHHDGQGIGNLKVTSNDDFGIRGGKIYNCTFNVRRALGPDGFKTKTYALNIGSQEEPKGDPQLVSNVIVENNLFNECIGKNLHFVLASKCIARYNRIIQPNTRTVGVDGPMLRGVGTHECIFESNLIVRDFIPVAIGTGVYLGGYKNASGRVFQSKDNQVINNLFMLDNIGEAIYLQSYTSGNYIARNKFIRKDMLLSSAIRVKGENICSNMIVDNTFSKYTQGITFESNLRATVLGNTFCNAFDCKVFIDPSLLDNNVILNKLE